MARRRAGAFAPIWVAPQKFSGFCPKDQIHFWPFRGQGPFFLARKGPGRKELTPWQTKTIPYKIYLSEDEMPRTWYNVRADMKVKPAPLRNPATGAPMSFDDLRPVFCDELIRQELDNDDREIPIPDEILDFYKMYRPSPLVRAYCLEKRLQTPAKKRPSSSV